MTEIIKTKEQVLAEIRYSQRIAQRTARLYRRIQSFATFTAIVGGAGVFTRTSTYFPEWMSIVGAILLAVFGALVICIRPSDKAVPNEIDVKKYADLHAKAREIESVDEIEALLAEARKTDASEIESMRAIAFNDVMSEINRDDQAFNINPYQKFLRLIA